jgi:hypothetical protein
MFDDPSHTNFVLKSALVDMNLVAFGVWLYFSGRDAVRSDNLMVSTARYFDPEKKFIFRYGINLYFLKKDNDQCTPEFLAIWDAVYWGYWRRALKYCAAFGVYMVFAGILETLINYWFHP